MTYGTIRYEVDPDAHVATITLDRPDRLNAFNRTMCEEVKDAWRRVKQDAGVHAVVLRAAGDRAFSAGLDVTEQRSLEDGSVSVPMPMRRPLTVETRLVPSTARRRRVSSASR